MTENEICKCGHHLSFHKIKGFGLRNRNCRCKFLNCPCKKFTPIQTPQINGEEIKK